jgi:predicted ATPase
MRKYAVFYCRRLDDITDARQVIAIENNDPTFKRPIDHYLRKFRVYGANRDALAEGVLLIHFNSKIKSGLMNLGDDYELVNRSGTGMHSFISMLPDIDSYRKIVDDNGVEAALEILTSVNDIVANKFLSGEIRDEFVPDFDIRDFLSSNSAYFAYRKAFAVFQPNSLNTLDASGSFDLQFKLQKFRNSHRINFRFGGSELFSNRIALLIGKNGVGKSRALRSLLMALHQKKDERTQTATLTPRPEVSRILAFSTATSEGALPQRLNGRSGIAYRYFSLMPNLRLESKSRELLMGIIDILNARNMTNGQSRSSLLASACEELFNINDIAFRVGGASAKRNIENITIGELLNYAEQDRISLLRDVDFKARVSIVRDGTLRSLSSGEATFLLFTVHAIAHLDSSSMVLIDEPENHMHPNLISTFMIVLEKLLDMTKSIAIIATHSPFLVRELQRTQVHILQSSASRMQLFDDESSEQTEKPFITVANPRLQTLGSSVDSISNYVFGDGNSDKLYQRILSTSHFRGKKNKDLITLLSKYKDELSPEALTFVRNKVAK